MSTFSRVHQEVEASWSLLWLKILSAVPVLASLVRLLVLVQSSSLLTSGKAAVDGPSTEVLPPVWRPKRRPRANPGSRDLWRSQALDYAVMGQAVGTLSTGLHPHVAATAGLDQVRARSLAPIQASHVVAGAVIGPGPTAPPGCRAVGLSPALWMGLGVHGCSSACYTTAATSCSRSFIPT